MLFISSAFGLAVPIEISLYICLESPLMTTPLMSFANLSAMLDFPEAVGPAMTMIGLEDLIILFN